MLLHALKKQPSVPIYNKNTFFMLPLFLFIFILFAFMLLHLILYVSNNITFNLLNKGINGKRKNYRLIPLNYKYLNCLDIVIKIPSSFTQKIILNFFQGQFIYFIFKVNMIQSRNTFLNEFSFLFDLCCCCWYTTYNEELMFPQSTFSQRNTNLRV